WSQFARLATDAHPNASPGVSAASEVAAIPLKARGLTIGAVAQLASVLMYGGATDDADYGTLAYCQLLDPRWRELRKIQYVSTVTFDIPGSRAVTRWLVFDGNAFSSTGLPTVPVLSPPRAPRINGMDAFMQRAGVGLQPVLSWSKPAIGTPTSYWVGIEEIPE